MVQLAIGAGPLPERAIALWYVLGINPRTCNMLERRGEPQLAFDAVRQAGFSPTVVAAASEAFRKLRDPLCGIPCGRTRHCPVAAIEQWRARSGITQGPLFRPVDRHSVISNLRLSGEAVSLVVKERVAAAGFDPASYSGHSLRAGLATSAAQSGAPAWKVRQQTGHASDAMLIRYIRDGELFTDNVVGALL
jgi:hypothetical protein